jgi:glyoxylase-like metal-dependent hydrolase (beta-lactamase superfamily II)
MNIGDRMPAALDRRQLLSRCACAAFTAGWASAWTRYAEAADAPAVPEMKAQEAAPGCWYVQGQSALGSPANQNFISNAGFIVTSAGVVVIDALGSPALAERLLAEIRKVTPQPVTHVILTHYHADHVYGLQVFAAWAPRSSPRRTGANTCTPRPRASGWRPRARTWRPGSTARPAWCRPPTGSKAAPS